MACPPGCAGGSISKRSSNRLNQLVRKVRSVVFMDLDPLVTAAEKRSLKKDLALHTVIGAQRSPLRDRLLLPRCKASRLRDSFVPRSIKLYKAALGESERNRRRGEKELAALYHGFTDTLYRYWLCDCLPGVSITTFYWILPMNLLLYLYILL